MHNAYAEK